MVMSVDPCSRQMKRRKYLKTKYKSINDRFQNYKKLGLEIEVSGFRDLSGTNSESDQSEEALLICPFCKKTESCSHCPE